jgi:hypothetical protein
MVNIAKKNSNNLVSIMGGQKRENLYHEILCDTRLENPINRVRLSGEILEEFKYSHQVLGDKYLETKIAVKRLDGKTRDIVQVIVPELYLLNRYSAKGKFCEVWGTYRNFTKVGQLPNKQLELRCFAEGFDMYQSEEELKNPNENCIFLQGTVVGIPECSQTLKGNYLSEFRILVDDSKVRRLKHEMPCVAWDKIAYFTIKALHEGDIVQIFGRIQNKEKSFIKRKTEISVVNIRKF